MNDLPAQESPQPQPATACCPAMTAVKLGGIVLAIVAVVAALNSSINSQSARDGDSRSEDNVDPTRSVAQQDNVQDGSKAADETDSDELQPDQTEPRDEEYRKRIIGTWQDDYKGKRVLTVREDGTATMVVEPSGFGAIFAAKMTFEMNWSIEDGRLKKKTTGGEPATKVNLILKTMGDSVDEPILELTDERLLLLDKDGETKFDWKRVKVSEPAS